MTIAHFAWSTPDLMIHGLSYLAMKPYKELLQGCNAVFWCLCLADFCTPPKTFTLNIEAQQVEVLKGDQKTAQA